MSLTVREHLRRRRISILLMLISPLLAASGQQSRVTGPGSPELSKDGFPLATDTIDAYNVSGGERRLAGVYVQRAARRVAPDGRAQFLLITEFQASGGTDIALDTVHIDAAGLRPVSHVVRAAHHAAAIEYLADTVRGWIAVQGRPRQQIDRPLPRPVFPASLLEHVISLLPLEEQYETQVALYDMWSDTKQLTGIRVIESTTIPHQGRMRPAWLVEEIRGDRATRLRWVDKTTGRVLQAHDRPPSAPNPDDGYWRIVR